MHSLFPYLRIWWRISCFTLWFLVFFVISENTFGIKVTRAPQFTRDACSNTKNRGRWKHQSIINYLFRARVARNDCPIYSGMKLYKLQMGRFFSVISPNTIYTYFWEICEKAVKVSIVPDFAMSLQSLSTSTHQQKINPRNKWPMLSLDCSAWISMDPPSVRIGWPPPLPQCSNKWIWIHG